MYKNISDKVKTASKALCWLGIIVSCIVGIVYMGTERVLAGLLILVVGSLSSWISSLFAYGFGHLLENTDKLVAKAEPDTGTKGLSILKK